MTPHHNSASFSCFDIVCMKSPYYLLILFVAFMLKNKPKQTSNEPIQPGWVELKRDY